MIKIGRNINGICLNSLEWLLDDTGQERLFKDRRTAHKFLYEQGYKQIDIEYLTLKEV